MVRARSPEDVAVITGRLAETWPDAVVELDHRNAYQLLVATILSAQSTDKMINTITPGLFAKYPDAAALAQAEQGELEQQIFRSGFYRNKAKHLIAMARAVVEQHGGAIPETMDELCALPGVARKTANVVLGCALGKNVGFIVDTHVTRLAARLGFTGELDPVKIEQDMMRAVPQDQWTRFANRLIWHGRRICFAKQPNCDGCTLAPACPSAGLFKLPPAKPANRPTNSSAKMSKTEAIAKADATARSPATSKRPAASKPSTKSASSKSPTSKRAAMPRGAKRASARAESR